MNAMKSKIKSRAGASITFALLLFLVCAVVSSVVIVAATAAGGRMSTLQEMDQRYFAATSAADVLRQRLHEKSAIVTYTKDIDGKVTEAATNATGLLGEVSASLIKQDEDGEIKIWDEPKKKEVDNTEYECSISGTLKNGLLTFKIEATGGRMNNGTYTLYMIFSSTVMEVDDDSITDGETELTTTSGKAKVSWKLNSVRKVAIDE